MGVVRGAYVRGVAVAAGVFVLLGVVSAVVPNPLFRRMVEITVIDYVFLVLTSILAGAYVVQRASLAECSGDGCAYGGVAGGFLAVACPPCNAILVAAIGTSAAVAYVDPLRPVFGALGVALLSGIIYVRMS